MVGLLKPIQLVKTLSSSLISAMPSADDQSGSQMSCHRNKLEGPYSEKEHLILSIGARTGPAGPAVAGPFSPEVETILMHSIFVWS